MKIKQSHLVGFSPCGSTFKVLRAIAAGLPGKAEECSLTLPGERTTLREFGPEDMVIMGFPVYGGRLPRIAEDLFKPLKGNQTPAILVAVYGNRDYEDALLEMQQCAVANGFIPFAAVAAVAEHVFQPQVGAGRPDHADKTALEAFGHAALQSLLRLASPADIAFTAPGQTPFRKEPQRLPFTPETLESCIECGACIDVCPNAAIPDGDPYTTLAERCLACAACVTICPVQARVFTAPQMQKVSAWLLENFSPRREPEFFPAGIV